MCIRDRLQDLSDEEIRRLQAQLNRQYDAFRGKHGLINSRSAELSFRDDSSYYLLCSLENVDEKGNFISKMCIRDSPHTPSPAG